MSGSGMIAARPEGLLVDDGDVLPASGCVTIDDKSEPGSWARALAERAEPVMVGIDYSSDYIAEQRANERGNIALGMICHAAAKCTEVQSLADCGRIDRDGADLFVRRYSESIADIVGLIAPAAPKQKGN